jgi:large subunit ribosomal protein L21
MYAVIKTGGKQYRVTPGDVIRVEKLAADTGQSVNLNEVLLVCDGDNVRVGNPMLTGAAVTATVRSHGRGDKVLIFKMRRRKNYRRTIGHRQGYTEIEITAIK